MKITYRREGDILLPNLFLNEEGDTEIKVTLGKYGKMRKTFLQNEKPMLYQELLMSGELIDHLEQIDQTARERMFYMMEQAKNSSSLPDKSEEPLMWAGRMNMMRLMAEEIVLQELIYQQKQKLKILIFKEEKEMRK